MESLSPDPEEISLDIGDLKENPIVKIPYKADAYNSDSQEKLMKRVQEVAQTGRRMKDGLAKLRTETDSSQEGEFTDRHKRRGELLEKFRQDLTAQREGLATTLTEVFEEVHRDPDQSASELFEIVAQNSQTYHFDTPQLTAIAEGLLEYEKKHQAVERASAQHPDPAEFFAANFGSPPQGKVEVIKGPMTVNFRCYDPEDYLTAYSGGKEHINEENKARATSSG